jgi:hypothetical protein
MQPTFKSCLKKNNELCSPNVVSDWSPEKLAQHGYLREFFDDPAPPLWSCEKNVQYICMRNDHKVRQKLQKDTFKYYGKWPFVRVFGCQEIFSVIFSIGNFLAHFIHFNSPPVFKSDPYYWLFYFLWPLVCLNSWVWSAAFHAYEHWATERLDYHCAVVCVL